MIRSMLFATSLITALGATAQSGLAAGHAKDHVFIGPRPLFLVDRLPQGELKEKLQACSAGPFSKSDWSIGHRGAPMQFPEHTAESYKAAARMGAGILECDVTFTKDRQLICRHAQNDLHTTTNVLATPLAGKCTKPFTPATTKMVTTGEGADKVTKEESIPATAECRASDFTLDEIKTLNGKMDAADTTAKDVAGYMDGTANWRTDLYATTGTILTHAESIQLFKKLGTKFTPELKSPSVEMPFEGDYTQQMYAQQLIDDYKAAGVPASDVFAQSFNLEDVIYWIENEPEFGKQAVYLDDSYNIDGWSPMDPSTWAHQMDELKAMGVNYIAPPMWVLVTLEDGEMVPSAYARMAREAGLDIITWTVERSGLLKDGGGWYYQTVADRTKDDAAVLELLHVLHEDVGVVGVFSDWPATTTYYANCFGLK